MTLNRRDFIGAMAATATIGKLGISLGQATSSVNSRQGAWARSGVIDAGGTHEPYIFVVRRGGQSLDARQVSNYEQSEGLIQQLHNQGVEVFHTHLYKGFGMAAEQADMEDTRKAVAIAHRLGMKVDTYIQWNTMMYETFFAEEPRAVNWIQRDVAGLPILLPYGYQQSFRYRPCFSNQEYLDYLKKVVRYAIEEAKTDFIHFDNFDLNAEPDSCHCTWCVQGFRKFLQNKYSNQERRERFGFENVSYINPPQWNRDNPAGGMEIIYDPALQEWVDFRCQEMSDALQQMVGYVKTLNPEVAIEINPGGIDGQNRPWTSAVDHARLLKFTECFWSEEDDLPAYLPDGRLISKIRTYKLARTYNNVLLTYTADNTVAMAEGLAFNQTPGFVGSNPIEPETLRYIAFYRKHQDLYRGSEDITPVAVFRSYASLTYNNAATQLSAILVEQALIQSRIPFALIFDEHLRNLADYKVLILPNSECLSDEQISLIRRYVDQGGGLVVTEQAGLYDEWRRVRIKPGLNGLVENQAGGTAYQESVKSELGHPSAASRTQVGSGRVVYVPVVEFDGAMPPLETYFGITNIFWKRPKNWRDIIEAVQWAAKDEFPITVEGPDFLVANCTLQRQDQRLLLHLVNYGGSANPAVSAIRVRVVLPQNKVARTATLYAPESADARSLAVSGDRPGAAFTVPEVRDYALISVQW
jgi:hypothetical protein